MKDESEVLGKQLNAGDRFMKDGKVVEAKEWSNECWCGMCVYWNQECSNENSPKCLHTYFEYVEE